MVIKKESKTSAYRWGREGYTTPLYVSPSHIPNNYFCFTVRRLAVCLADFLKNFYVGTQIKAAESVFYSQRWKYSISDKRRLGRKY